MAKKKSAESGPPEEDANLLGGTPRAKPLVFISHDARDADIAEAFSNLLRDASGGILRSFRSSDRKGTTGIEFGADWYSTIMENLKGATDVVALLTSNSIDRPWILYEAGVAKGRLDTVVFGLAVGVSLDKAGIGPFAQFQNSSDDENSLTTLVLQLIRRNPDADPREEAVRRQVIAFRDATAALLKQRAKETVTKPSSEIDASAVAKLFEEVKIMFRQLPDQLESSVDRRVRNAGKRGRRTIGPELLREIHYSLREGDQTEQEAGWLRLASYVRDDLPWLYELVMEIYRAIVRGSPEEVDRVQSALMRALTSRSRHKMAEDIARHGGSRELGDFLEELPMMLDSALRHRSAIDRVTRPPKLGAVNRGKQHPEVPAK